VVQLTFTDALTEPVSAGGAGTALLLLLLEGGTSARGLPPALLLGHGSLLSVVM